LNWTRQPAAADRWTAQNNQAAGGGHNICGRRVRQASLGTGLVERETIGSVATRALIEDWVEMEFLTGDPVAQAVPASE
jgi:hypothetical protein